MSGMEVFSKLREYGRNRQELKNFCSENIKEILEHLPVQIMKNDGDLIKLFPGLSDPDNVENKIKVVDIVLDVLRKESTSLSHCGNIISRVCLELTNLPSDAVIRWCNDSVKSIIEDTDVNMIWRDVLPECLNAVTSMVTVNLNDAAITAREFKLQILESLLECQWKERQLVQLTSMLKDIKLSDQEHRRFIVKICSFMRDMSPDSLPPLVHQLLKLCKLTNVKVVLAHLSHYFNLRLYSKLATLPQDSQATTMDIDDIEQYSVSELQICLSTCIYHTMDAAVPEVIQRELKAWPRSQMTREPFILSVALAMIDKGMEFKAVCLEVLRSAVEQSVMDEIKRKESAWIRGVQPAVLDLDEMFRELATGGGNHRSSIWMGLIHLCFALMSGKRGPEARICARYGVTTLARLARAHSCTAPQILSVLADKLAADSSNLHYIECLRLLCKTAPLSVEPCSELRSIVENCQPAPDADGVFAAVHPLINFSERLRDTLVMSCRKGLYSSAVCIALQRDGVQSRPAQLRRETRAQQLAANGLKPILLLALMVCKLDQQWSQPERDSAHRCLAASGIMTVLKYLRMSAMVTSTQDTEEYSSQYSQTYISVLTVDVHASQQGASVSTRVSKDTICYEMISILRRCLDQDSGVKQLLYSRWYSCVKDKPSLHSLLLEMLYDHLSQYLSEEGELVVVIDKCVLITSSNAVLIEPIGQLVYLIAQLLQCSPDDDVESIFASRVEEENLPRRKLKKIMAEFSKNNLLAQIDMENLIISDATIESQANCIKVQQLLLVYEALVAHHLMQWSPTDGRASVVYHLYKEYTQLFDNSKPLSKTSKKASKLNESTDTVKSSKIQSGCAGKPKKAVKTAKDKTFVFKPPCLWDLKICYRILELLYSTSEVRWSSIEERALLCERVVVHRWAARSITASLQRAHDTALVHTHAPRIGALLFKCCLCRFQDIYDMDPETAVYCLEMFDECIKLLCSPKNNCDVVMYLPKITECHDAPEIIKAEILSKIIGILLTAEHSPAQGDCVLHKRLVNVTMEAAVTVLKIPTDFHLDLSKEINRMENYMRETKQDCSLLLGQLLATSTAETCETSLLDDFLKRLADVMVAVSEKPVNETQLSQDCMTFPWVHAGVVVALRMQVTAHLQDRLACVKHMLAHARSLATALQLTVESNYAIIAKDLKEARSSCVLQLCQITGAVGSLCALQVGAGTARGEARAAERTATLASRLHLLAVDLLRSLKADAAEDVGLENLLNLLGNPFTLVLRQFCEKLDGKLVPRLVRAAERFRSLVFRLDIKGQYGYRNYVSKRIGMSRGIRNGADEQEDVTDVIMDMDNEDSDMDSNADTVIIEELEK